MTRIYRGIIRFVDRHLPNMYRPLWNHPAGPKTIFFWAPLFKWGLVIAAIGDMHRPAEKISILQSSALAVSGLLWARYSTVIIPKNWSLFSVNLFISLTEFHTLHRGLIYQYHMADDESEDTPNKEHSK